MEVLIFLIVIVALIVVHELGHFIAAKLTGMRVDEFGLGYPPRALTLGSAGGTRYTLNWLPFGGFVKIYGENSEAAGEPAFSSKSRPAQAFVLAAGVLMNLLFAYLLIAGALFAGTPRALAPNEIAGAKGAELAVASVLPGSPASRAGILSADSILSASDPTGSWHSGDPESFTRFVGASGGAPIQLEIKRNGSEKKVGVAAERGVAPSDPSRYALGVEVANIGIVPLSLGAALTKGATLTWQITKLTTFGLLHFFYGVFTLSADLSQVAGPIGIAGAIGGAAAAGLGNLLALAAVISINLALINLLPVPALDGGRLLFVAIEAITRRPIKAVVAQTVNSIGFAFLILLMAVVTLHDLSKIVG
ncbi:site-2 protease family protein [Candidatus Kaiserbacteria bacterium]|nr:site-2 protease family protein [Candidatus Kaiserbacteria bacterium]